MKGYLAYRTIHFCAMLCHHSSLSANIWGTIIYSSRAKLDGAVLSDIMLLAQPGQNNLLCGLLTLLDARCCLALSRLSPRLPCQSVPKVCSLLLDVNPTCFSSRLSITRENDGHHFVGRRTAALWLLGRNKSHGNNNSGRCFERSNANLAYMRLTCLRRLVHVGACFF